ncbi:hypothetical protein EJ07DRAFT_172626 [Lizonia empirigonia]|nr:hypothetical protein EJ07DRAFT_172626 [Lizonia empirigonia]
MSSSGIYWPSVTVLDKHPRQINAKLKPDDPTVLPLEGVSVGLINAFQSDIFDLLHPIKENADGRLFQTDPTIESTRAVADVLVKIDNTKLIDYRKTWDPEIGVPGNWLGLEPCVRDGDESAGDGKRMTTASGLSTSANTVTAGDPITLNDNAEWVSVKVKVRVNANKRSEERSYMTNGQRNPKAK